MKFHFDKQAADDVVFFSENLCTHVKGEKAGEPIILEDWQKKDIVEPIFGWKKPDGTRKVRTAYIEIPRKNAKSTLSAVFGLFLLIADGEKGAEVYCAAASRDQISSVYDPAKFMVMQNPYLNRKLHPFKNSITVRDEASFFKAISADANTKHGFNASGIIIDELHAHKSRDLYDVLVTSTGSRRQPLTIIITTAGFDRNSICWEMHEYTRKINAGLIEDDSFFGIIYAADENDDPFSEETWKKANPGYGTIVKKEYLKEHSIKAQNEPAYLNTFKRLNLNIWTASHTKWIENEVWNACNKGGNLSKLKGRWCVAALDLASTRDINALVLLFPSDDLENPSFDILCRFYCPEEAARKREFKGDVSYYSWSDQGYMTITPGNVTDYTFIENDFTQFMKDYQVRVLAYDNWNSSQLIINIKEKHPDLELDPVSQGVKEMSPPTKELYKIIASERINHYGNPVLAWMADNVMIFEDANENIKLNKQKATDKIDGIVATVISLAAYESCEKHTIPKKIHFF